MNHSPLAELILEEMLERDWSLRDVVMRMGSASEREYGVNLLALQMYLSVDDAGCKAGPEMHPLIAKAFGVSVEFVANLDKNEPPRLLRGVPAAPPEETKP